MCIKCVFRSDLTSENFFSRTRSKNISDPDPVKTQFFRPGPDGLYLLEYLFALQMYVISIVKKFESFAIYPCAQTAM
jgi:hypothetical protein